MKIKEYIAKIIVNGDQKDMEELSEMLDESIMKLKIYDPECYKKYKTKLLGMAYNYKFDEEMAKEIVENMKPLSEVWDLNTTNSVKAEYGINANDYDFYIVMNSMINDYNEVIDKDDIETYVKMSNAFINDEDAVKNKVWKYYIVRIIFSFNYF